MTRVTTNVCACLAIVLILSACDSQSGPEEALAENPGALPAEDGAGPVNPPMEYLPYTPAPDDLVVSRQAYVDKLHGFWLGQCIANWTGIVTETDKIGGEGPAGEFYTRDDWGQPD